MEVLVLLLGAAATGGVAFLATRRRSAPAPPREALVAPPRASALAVGEFAPPGVAERLLEAGVRTTRDLLETDHVEGVAATTLRDLRRLAGLLAIPNVGREEAALLVAAGVEMPEDILRVPPKAFAATLNALNAEVRCIEGALTPGEVRQWAESVREGLAAAPPTPGGRLTQPSIALRRERASAGVA